MFEQSGTFKNEFKKLGMEAIDLDILNDFGETDRMVDLFAEIEKGYEGKSLYEKLVDMHKECTYQFEKYGDCTSRCPYSSEVNKDSGLCVFGDTLPSDWNPDLIPEEYR